MKAFHFAALLMCTACGSHDKPGLDTAARNVPSPASTGPDTLREAKPLPDRSRETGIPDTLTVYRVAGETLRPTDTIRGRARGPWYFEAQFSIHLVDSSGRQVAVAPARADGDWKTTGWVPFSARLSWKSYRGPATLLFKKSNASGLPELDRSYRMAVIARP